MNSSRLPRISIVTPSYNQGKYLEATIQSVLGQNYPNLEYIVMDGGSADQSIPIIRKYESKLAYWESHGDDGQAQAINQGFALATGDIFGWLNSDDMYLPGALAYVADRFMQGEVERDMRIVFGNCIHLDEETREAHGSDVEKAHAFWDLTLCDYIIQPSAFWTRRTFAVAGKLDETLHYGFDWEWFIRAKRRGAVLQAVDRFLSIYRIHPEHKSRTGGEKRIGELGGIYRKWHSEKMAQTYLKFRRIEPRIGKLNNVFYKMRIHKFIEPAKLIYYMYFREIGWEEFNNIRQM